MRRTSARFRGYTVYPDCVFVKGDEIFVILSCGIQVLRVDGDRIVPVRSFPLTQVHADRQTNIGFTWAVSGNTCYALRRCNKVLHQIDLTTGADVVVPFKSEFKQVS